VLAHLGASDEKACVKNEHPASRKARRTNETNAFSQYLPREAIEPAKDVGKGRFVQVGGAYKAKKKTFLRLDTRAK
jgi:hypothetical protein